LPTDVRVVLMTAPDPATAERLGATLVEERLATCANVLPSLSSVYWWQGKVEKASESLLLLKTVEGRVPALRERAVRLHPYEVPELLVIEVADGFQPYLDWVRQESGPPGTADEGGRTD
jgi:periplasmic divalent cation tolerance protein